MAQFAVYRNKNPRSKAAFPLLVDVQSDQLEDLQTRDVVHGCSMLTIRRAPTA